MNGISSVNILSLNKENKNRLACFSDVVIRRDMAIDESEDMKNVSSSPSNGMASTFFETTTIHGIPQIFTSKNCYQRLFWSTLFAVAFGLLTWQVSELVVKVHRKDITIETTTLSKKELNDFHDFAMMKLNSCRFDDEQCKPTDISLDGGVLVGNCVGFNHFAHLIQKQPGPLFGLSMIFNVNEEDYLPLEAFENSGNGIFVYIAKDNLPMESYTIRNEGIAAAPGTLTKLKLNRREIKRLPHPYPDNCMVDKKVNVLGQVTFKSYGDYTVRWCRLACVWANQMKVCGFVSSEYKSIIGAIVDREKTKISFANSTDADEIRRELKCLHKAASAVDDNDGICNCKPYCSEEDYYVQISSSKWPTSNQADALLNRMKNSWPSSSSIQNWTTENIYKNLVKIEVYYSNFRTERMEQKPAYGWNEFLSDLGGQSGLWIGASVYSILELCSLLLIPLKGSIRLWNGKSKQVALQK